MIVRRSRSISLSLAVICCVCVALLSVYSYKTGCTADLKTGSWGDTELALHFSQISLAWLVSAVITAILAISFLPGLVASTRAALATTFFFIGGLGLWYLAYRVEVMGMFACSAAA